jgi:hypothetical protein
MLHNAATPLSNELFQENWTALSNSSTEISAKISYQMVEKVPPPAYMWDRISKQLDAEDHANYASVSTISTPSMITLLVVGALAFVGACLYMLL